MKYFWLIFITAQCWAANPKELDEAKQGIQALISPLLPGVGSQKRPEALSGFRVDGCPKYKVNWMNVLMIKEKAELSYRFQEGCDIEGTIAPRVFSPFPLELKLRHLKHYDHIKSTNRITATLESEPKLHLDLTDAELKGPKSLVKFTADYEVQIDPLSPKKPVKKNLGGQLHITEINGEKTAIKEKILVR